VLPEGFSIRAREKRALPVLVRGGENVLSGEKGISRSLNWSWRVKRPPRGVPSGREIPIIRRNFAFSFLAGAGITGHTRILVLAQRLALPDLF
jgi:hypothetical protein